MDKTRAILPWITIGFLCFLTNPCVSIDIDQCDRVLDHGSYTACYWYPETTATWQEAEKECGTSGGHVIAITSDQVASLAMSIMRNHSIRDLWLGIREESFPWRWINTFEEVDRQGCYLDEANDPDLAYNSPLVNITYESCKSVCSKKRYIYAGVQEEMCWCGNQFGRHGQTDECNRLCEGNADQVCGGPRASHVLTVSGVFSNWEIGQPNNHQGYQTCAILDREYDFEWNDVLCREWQGVVCQVDKSSQACVTNATNTVIIGESCYVVDPQRRTWFKSREHCMTNLGGDLAKIRNMEEHVALRDYLTKNTVNVAGFWISLIRAKWQWSTGDELVYTNWDNGRPNGQVKYQSCAKMDQNGRWDDTDCDGQWAYICQTDNAIRASKPVRTSPAPPPVIETTASDTIMITTTEKPLPVEEPEPLFSKGEIAAIASSGAFVVIILLMIGCKCWLHRGREAKEKRFDYFFGVDLPVSSTTDLSKPKKDQQSNQKSNGISNKQEEEFMKSFETTTVEITPDITRISATNGDVIHKDSDILTEDINANTENGNIPNSEHLIKDEEEITMQTDANESEMDHGNGDSAYDDSVETLDLIADLDDTQSTGTDNRAMMF